MATDPSKTAATKIQYKGAGYFSPLATDNGNKIIHTGMCVFFQPPCTGMISGKGGRLWRMTYMHLKLKADLPGKRAQLQMAPEHRVPQLLRDPTPEDAVHSAVVALLSPKSNGAGKEELMDWSVLLIRRNTYPGVHSGQISFPGGKYESADGGFWETACREAFEEVGLGASDMEQVGQLTSVYVPPSNFTIHPFIALDHSAGAVHPDPREVADYKNIPIRTFNPAAATILDFDFGRGRLRPAPAWRYEDFIIWGATAMILSELYQLIRGGALVRF